MAITLQGHTADYYGESTDDKPTDAEINTKYTELNTGKEFFFNGSTWVEIGGTTT